MEKSLQHQLYGASPRSPFSSSAASSRTRQSSASSFSPASRRQVFHGGAVASFKKSIAGGVLGQTGRFSVSGRSNQSIVGIRSDFNVVESYGFQLPVLVHEALTFTEKSQNVSVMCSQNGWAWVVHGRRLLIWQYKDTRNSGNSPPTKAKDPARTPQRRAGSMAQCRELTLPHCDIGHKASLVSIFLSEGQQMASCVAVSPTGDVRYWPSIAHDGSSVDVTGILDGQEFDYLLELPKSQSYMLVTTTCSLVLLQLQLINGRYVLQHKAMRQPSGFLGGIGKKFASIIIGMNSSTDKESKFVSIACESASAKEAVVAVLADRWLQRWCVATKSATETLIFEDAEVVRKIREEFQQKFWNIRADNVGVELHLLDMKISNSKTYVLAGAVNPAHTPQMYYGIAVLMSQPQRMHLQDFIPLKLSQFYSANTEKTCLGLRFIVSRTQIYLYTDKVVYPVNLANPSLAEIDAEKIEFHLQDDRILTAAICGHIPLFFSRMHGLVCVTPGDFDSTEFLSISNAGPDAYSASFESGLNEQTLLADADNENNLYMFDLDPDAMCGELKDEVSQLKAAFVYHLKRNNHKCNAILNELLRNTTETQTGALTEANHLDRIVIAIAEDLAEDIPAADPRWEQAWGDASASRQALGSSSSLQILTQLKEKNMALRHFVEFLHSTGVWDKLCAVPSGGGNVLKPTCYIVADINEKIIAAIALRTLQSKYSKLIEEAINHVVEFWNKEPHGGLTAQDLFYVHICRFQDIFQAFSDIIDCRIDSQQQTSSVASLISDINTIVLHILAEVAAYRELNSVIYTPSADKLDTYEYLPWTAMSGNVGLRDTLSHLVDISVRYGARCASEAELKQKLYQQILEIIDFILDGRKNYLESVRDTEKYNVLMQQFESQRRDLISILIEDGQYELAAQLAEKYLDFQSLVVICDETNNQERLDSYIKKFEDYDFSQFAINWHLRQNRQGEVFERFKGNQAALSQFMRDHPTLGWIQLVFNGDFERASKILLQLAQSETEYVQRKKSMLSLAKLATFAAADSDLTTQVETIDTELHVIDYQDQLSDTLLQAFGYDVENRKVLKIEEIINLFIAEENETATEFDFRKALELLNYLEEPYEARHKIWCAAILRDKWTDYNVNRAVEYVDNLLFFKLVELCHLMDGDIEKFLPPMDDFLNSGELGDLVHDKSFQYLLKLTYECISDTLKRNDDGMDM